MFRKTIVAAGFALAMAMGASASAHADVDISINLGFGGFFGSNISCQTGGRIVDRRFKDVKIRSCAGKNYDYTGRRNGKNYWIKVNRSSGRITEVRRIK